MGDTRQRRLTLDQHAVERLRIEAPAEDLLRLAAFVVSERAAGRVQ